MFLKKLGMTALCCGAMVMTAGVTGMAQMSGMDNSPAMTKSGDAAGHSFDGLVSMNEESIVGAAEAMPADKYDFAPSQEIFKASQKTEFATVRTFGAQVKHIAQANYFFFGTKGVKPPVDVKAIGDLKTKDEIVAALKKSFVYAHSQVSVMMVANSFDITDIEGHSSTRAANYAFGLMHMNDHYGQMVEYLRMNGIVPPASRK